MSAATLERRVHPVDQVPPVPKLTVLGLQHVLAFYAGAVIVPIVIAGALDLSTQDLIHLINADLFTCGIATIIQSVGFWKVGVRLPLIQGVTFTAVSPIIAIGLAAGGGREGLPEIYGSIIVAGLATFFVAPYFSKLIRFFPPVVTGTLLTVMGATLIGVAASDIVRGAGGENAAGAELTRNLAYALATLGVIVLMQRFFKGFMATVAVLMGLVLGTAVAVILGDTSFTHVADASWVGVTTPFWFGMPKFTFAAIVSMLIVMAITAVETTGDVFATGEVVGKRITPKHIAGALRADGLSTALGGVLNSFPYTCFAQNVGLVRLTRVKSRWVVAMAGAFMIILGLLPKAGAIVAAIPGPVLGGASLAMFANVAFVGIQTLGKADLHDNRNQVIVSTSLALAMLVTLQPSIAQAVPGWLQIFFGSGVTIGAITAIILNLLFFHVGRRRGPDVATSGRDPLNLEQINAMDEDSFVETFRALYPEETWPIRAAFQSRPFHSTAELRAAFQNSLMSGTSDEQHTLIHRYRDIADLLLDEDPGHTPSDIAAFTETGSLAADRMDDHDRENLMAVSRAYQDKFGFPLVVSLNATTTLDSVVEESWVRVEASPERELHKTVGEVANIADRRFDALVADANPIRSAWSRKFEALN
ncbi:solute carrier family 23 protein [Tessaracoccus sp. ZS01]|uniref:solute carrier family 23 protein n=1 Tax=Tessaracoccus sp. ZS01 TaxID=1906324 RepID=UPI00096E4834|nr:solute carrier family 23 protein [Tessaracoccus sp. ZS01]MCG6566366.1 uracil-xanthine permease [Tessaracoccus sp. ZS01]OMG58832.1 uracil-xanthine permease [Tessaracoccus sp. ZS01]